ncbi:MAG: M48 family metallopeptidase [bacterium]|nr:M48 family metallopeptidase [bacterium]
MWEQIAANRRKSTLLVITAALLLAALGWAGGEYFLGKGGGTGGVLLALVVWLVMTLAAWFQGDSIMLSVAGAHRVQKADFPQLFNIVEEMTLAAGLSRMPAVYVIDDPAPNAFATGRRAENASVAVTSGLLRTLDRDELQGVVAHEMAHVRNRDIQLMLFAGVLAGAIVILAETGLRGMWLGGGRSRSRREGGGDSSGLVAIFAMLLMILAPIIAQLIYFAVSRKREYLADASAASFTRYPEGLASALEKISRAPQRLGGATSATAPMYIINPLKRAGQAAANATSTHPPIDERVRILRSMAGSGLAEYERSFRAVTNGGGVIPKSALKEEAAAPAPARPVAGPAPSTRENARQVDDYFYRQGGYRRVDCACGTTLRIPPDFASPAAKCPRCGTLHDLR